MAAQALRPYFFHKCFKKLQHISTPILDLIFWHADLDVRTVEEFVGGHPPGSINIPVMVAAPTGMSPNADFAAAVEKAFPDKVPEREGRQWLLGGSGSYGRLGQWMLVG